MDSSSSTSSAVLTTPPDIEAGGTPAVTLDAPDIDHAMAARLTIALLGHMLYMKGQVPFPVQSIARMARHAETTTKSRTTVRVAKKRTDFLQSYDDLKSHLHTTFTALSTALALNEARYPINASFDPPSSARRPAKVYILLMLGPSPSSAKVRVLLELDGLRVERFGEWEYLRNREKDDRVGGGDADDGSDRSSEDSAEYDSAVETDAEDALAPSSPLYPPRSPSPSPSPTPTYASAASPPRVYTSSSTPAASSHAESPPPSPSSVGSFTDSEESAYSLALDADHTIPLALTRHGEEATLLAGERSLTRALFAAGEDLGFNDEIAPTQAHIFIRAPRRLTHPTWLPRQSLGGMLDRHVQRFLATESHQTRVGGLSGKGAFGAGVRTVGVRVICRGVEAERDDFEEVDEKTCSEGRESESDGEADDEEGWPGNEEDELIWWSWDGKLVGFAD